MVYVVLRSFSSSILLKRGDVINPEHFDMPYGRAGQLVSQRYLAPAPDGTKITVAPDLSQVPGAQIAAEGEVDGLALADSLGDFVTAEEPAEVEASRNPEKSDEELAAEAAALEAQDEQGGDDSSTPETSDEPGPAPDAQPEATAAPQPKVKKTPKGKK